jgi:hypothetical protein
VGPFTFAAGHPHDEVINPRGAALPPTLQALLYADGAAQLAGLTLLVASVAVGNDAGPSPPPDQASRAPRPQLHVFPLLAPGALGLSATVTTW